MHTIIAIAVLTVMAHSQGPDDCTEYCTFLKSNRLPLFWRQTDCECSLEYHRTNNRHNKPTKFKRHSKLDNSAIYYEPSDEYPYQSSSFADYPFYIINPMYQAQNFKNTESRQARTISLNNLDHENKLNPSAEKRITTESVLRAHDIETDDSPIYLDIDIYKSDKNERSNNIQPPEMKNIGITEDDLMECIDLHILVFFRKNDENVDFREMWNETKINKYKGLSDSDLMIKIEGKCQQPIEIIHESLQQIRNSRPKKSQFKSTEDTETIKHNEKDKKKTDYKNVSDAGAIQAYYTTEIVINEERDNMLQLSNEEVTEIVTQLPTTSVRGWTDYTNFSSNSNNMVSEVNWNQESTTQNNSVVKTYRETVNMKSNSIAAKNDNLNSTTVIDSQTDRGSLSLNDFDSPTVETTTTVDIFFNNIFKFVTDISEESSTQLNQLKNAEIDAIYKTASKPLESDQHFKFIDKDIKIPRVFTKEFGNDTVVSSVNGNELISNNDFVEMPITSHGVSDDFLDKSSTVKFLTTETYIHDLMANTTDQFDSTSNFIKQNITTKSSDDLKSGSNRYIDNEELTIDSTKQGLKMSAITNDSDSNKSVEIELSSPKNNSEENIVTETRHSSPHDGPTVVKLSKKDPTASPETSVTETWVSISQHSESQKEEEKHLFSQDSSSNLEIINDLKVNETQAQVADSINAVNVGTSLSENVTSYNLTRNLNKLSNNIKDSQTNENRNLYIEDETEFSAYDYTTPNPVLFINETQDTKQSSNYDARLKHELIKNFLNKTNGNAPIENKGDINISMNQSFSRMTGPFDYSNKTDNTVEFTTTLLDMVSNPLGSTKTQDEEDTTLSNSNVSADISESSYDLISSENVVHEQLIHTATTNNPRDSEDMVIPVTISTVKAKKAEFDSFSKDIEGKLYFLFGENQVPVRFVQKSDGQIKLGLDGETMCDKIIKKDTSDSVIIGAICNCYQFKNCTKFN